MMRVPTAEEYAEMSWADQLRITRRLEELLREYAYTEVEDPVAARRRLMVREWMDR